MTGKRRYSLIAAIVCLTVLILSSCNQTERTDQTSETQPQQGVTQEEESMRVTEASAQAPEIRPGRSEVGETAEESQGESLAFVSGERIRVPYTVNKASVSYVTSASDVPAELSAETDAYDDSFFAEKALVVIEVSTSSGSAHPSIQAINRDDSEIEVTLYYEGTEIGTTDMATWLLWAEVERGLEDCQWSLANAALRPGVEAR